MIKFSLMKIMMIVIMSLMLKRPMLQKKETCDGDGDDTVADDHDNI